MCDSVASFSPTQSNVPADVDIQGVTHSLRKAHRVFPPSICGYCRENANSQERGAHISLTANLSDIIEHASSLVEEPHLQTIPVSCTAYTKEHSAEVLTVLI